MPEFTASNATFKGITDAGFSLLSDQIETNLKFFFDWAFLGIGAFFNVHKGQVAPYTGDQSRLRPTKDRNFVNGQVWEGFRPEWVWESGVNYSIQPIIISGVYVNNQFISINTPATGVYSHYIDYPNGRVIFNNSISQTGIVVQCEYSYRLYNVQTMDSPPAREVMFNSFRMDDGQFNQIASGVWSIRPDLRIPLPAVIIQSQPTNSKMEPYEISGGQKIQREIAFWIFAEHNWDRKQLFDTITYQKEKTFLLFDKNLVIAASAMPLNANGMVNPNALMYPVLCHDSGQQPPGYQFARLWVLDTKGQQILSNPPLFMNKAVWLSETYLFNI